MAHQWVNDSSQARCLAEVQHKANFENFEIEEVNRTGVQPGAGREVIRKQQVVLPADSGVVCAPLRYPMLTFGVISK